MKINGAVVFCLKIAIVAFALCGAATSVFASSVELRSYQVSDSLVAEYEKLPKVTDTLEAFKLLQSKINVYFIDRFEMEKELKAELADFPKFHKRINNNSIGSKAIREKYIEKYLPEDSIVDHVWLDSAYMDSLKSYMRKEAMYFPYSSTVSKFLHGMEGIVFADPEMMRRYALSFFAASLGVCYDTAFTYDRVKKALWSESEVENLFKRIQKNDLYANNKLSTDAVNAQVKPKGSKKKTVTADSSMFRSESRLPMSADEKLQAARRIMKIFNRRFRFLNCSEDRWNHAFTLLDTLYSYLLKDVVDSMTIFRSDFSDTIPVMWHANGCGCSRNKELNGNVYAIYPYWLSKTGGDTIDFSVVSRIAYYGISAMDDGTLVLPSGSHALAFFDRDGYSDFVNVAHEHNVKVDWIVKKTEWNELSRNASLMQNFFDKLVQQIRDLVNEENNSLFQRFVSNFTLDGNDIGRRGDGVTLWFENYPTDSINTEIFTRNFKRIQSSLQSVNEYAFVNLMVNQDDMIEKMNVRKDSTYEAQKRGIYSYKYFRQLIENGEIEKNVRTKSEIENGLRNFLIVWSNEPVSRNKLLIYNDLNQQLKGESRTEVLHAVVPMLWLDYNQWDQLSDDASFYNDAYYSLGIAPYGLLNDVEHLEKKLADTLLKRFEKDEGSHERQGAFAAFFCTHRWAFRLVNSVVYAFVFLLLFAYFVICRVNAYFSRRLALFVALVAIPPLISTLTLSNFDPVFSEFAGSALRWGCFAVIVIVVIAITLLQVYRSADLPKRKRDDLEKDRSIN